MSALSAKKMQSQKTVARILTATTSLLVAHGYHGTSIAAIAKATGLTKGALYAHFAGKEDLLLALIVKFESCFLDRLIETVDDVKGSAWDKLHCFLNFAAGFAEKTVNFAYCLRSSRPSFPVPGIISSISSSGAYTPNTPVS